MDININKTKYVIFHGDINEINTIKLIATCLQAIKEGKEHIYISFSSNGGRVNSGLTLFNTLKSMDVQITFHNTGSVESVAVIVFFAGNKRLMSKHARFLIHEPIRKFMANETLTAARLSELTQQLVNDREILSNLMEQYTFASKRTVSSWFRNAKVINSNSAISAGFVSDVMELSIPITGDVTTVATEVI